MSEWVSKHDSLCGFSCRCLELDELKRENATLRNANKNLQGQIDYMCSEIGKATNLEVQTPAGTVQTVREMMEGAERAHHRATEAEARLTRLRAILAEPADKEKP